MQPVLIFAVGFFCTLLCAAFYVIHFIEIRRINKKYEQHQQEKIKELAFQASHPEANKSSIQQFTIATR